MIGTSVVAGKGCLQNRALVDGPKERVLSALVGLSIGEALALHYSNPEAA